MANKTFHIPKSAIVETEDNVSILKNEQQTITTDASAVATLTNTDGFKAAHYSIAAERDGEVTTTTTTTTTTVTGSGGVDADTKLLLNANYIYDQSFSKRDITLNNTEVVRKGYYFDGSNDYISAGSNPLSGTDDFTIEFWAKKSSDSTSNSSIPGYDGVMMAENGGTSKPSWILELSTVRGFLFVGYDLNSNHSFAYQVSNSNLAGKATDGKWHHYALVRDNGTFSMYVDGVSMSNDNTSTVPTSTDTIASSGDFVIGKYTWPGYGQPWAFNGELYGIRISDTARYTADFDEVVTTKDSNHKLILTGETTDQSDSSQSLTFSGAHPTAKFGQGSFYFDGGSSSFITIPKDSSMSYANKSFAMEAWVMLEDYPSSYGAIFGDSKPSNGIEVALTSTGYIFVWIGNGSWITNSDNQSYNPGGSAPTLGGPQLSKGTWYHIAITFDGSAYRLFVNGALSQTYTTTTSTYWGTDTDLNIGTIRSNSSYVIDGYVSDFRLSVGTARYTAAFNNDLPTAPLETEDSRTKLLLNTNSALQDFEIGRMALAPTYAGDTTVVRRGYSFDGSDRITVNSSSDFSFGTDDFTIEAWINTSDNDHDSYNVMLSNWNYISNQRSWTVETASGKLRGYISTNGQSSGNQWVEGNTVPENTWQHIAFVRNGANLYLYQDGVETDSLNIGAATSLYSAENLVIGEDASLGGYNYLGYMSDIRITKGEALYTSAFTPPESLTAGTNTKLLLTGGEEDESSSEHSLTFSGAYPTAKFGDGAYYFDGSDKISIEAPSSDFDWSPTDKSWTWELWYNVSSGQQGGLIGTAASTSDTGGWDLYLGNGNNISAYGGDGSDTVYILTATSGKTYTAEEWRHIAVSYDQPNNKLRFFNDGTMFQETTGASFAPSTGKTLNIGDVAQDNQAFKGYIDDVRVTIGQARYTASFDVPTSELGSGTGTTTTTETTTTTTTGSSDVVLTKVHLVHDGSNVYFTEYGRTATDDDFLELSASYDAGVAKLHASTTSGSATLELTKKEFDFSVD